MAQAAEAWHVNIFQPSLAQGSGHCLEVKLRVMAGARDRPNVNDLIYRMRSEQGDKFVQGARGMPDGVHSGGRAFITILHPQLSVLERRISKRHDGVVP